MSGIRPFKLMLVCNLENLEGGSLLQSKLSLRSDFSKRQILSGETSCSSKEDNSCEKNSPTAGPVDLCFKGEQFQHKVVLSLELLMQ